MSDERDLANEQQIAGDPNDAVETGEAPPAIDAEGMGAEDPERTDLDAVWVSSDDDIPAEDDPSSRDQPESQGEDPLIADIGEDGEGDLSPEDL